MIQQALQHVLEGVELSQEEVEGTVREIAEGRATASQMGGFLVALRRKGETPSEVATFASTLREYSVRIRPRVSSRLVDTCGTGGDSTKTFNVSTLAALVVAGAGVPVAKHGNRSVTSRCGSADLLERLGYNLGASPESVKESIEKIGIGFMFAPNFHPAMKNVAPVRRELGVRTVFNLMGPLINPAGADAQVVGVYSPDLVGKVAEVLKLLGSREVIVVHSEEGMDEISISGRTNVAWLKDGEVTRSELAPEDFGVRRSAAPPKEVGSVDEGAKVALDVLNGAASDELADLVVANSAAAIVVGGAASSFREGSELARESLSAGAAMGKLTELIRASGGDEYRVELFAANK